MYSPTKETLEQQAIQYLKDTRQYSETKRIGELDEYVKIAVEATQWDASCAMADGELESAAWFAAIRRHILHREDD